MLPPPPSTADFCDFSLSDFSEAHPKLDDEPFDEDVII
jgi:hypothetical protein